MERIKIGITHGDINGVGYELILKTFQTEEMCTLCTPVIYGSPKSATYHRKAIGIQTNFQVIETAEQAKSGHLNMINCFDEEEQKIEIGQATEEAGAAALKALNMAMEESTAALPDRSASSSRSTANCWRSADQKERSPPCLAASPDWI